MESRRPRAREVGVVSGILPPGPLNSITDVGGVKVGHATVIRGDDVRTGVTAILPHGGNMLQEKVPGAVFVGNGYGKLMGLSQVNEFGEIETPILLTNTLSVGRAADALVEYMLSLSGNEDVMSVNPLVAETNDSFLNDIRGQHVGKDEVLAALRNASAGLVEEGSVGAGTGTVAFGFKGGIGTSSRLLPKKLGGYAVGVLVQTNFDGTLAINGAPIGRELGRYFLKDQLEAEIGSSQETAGAQYEGSVIMVVGTDAPLDARNLKRLAARTMLGLGRTGSVSANGSGDYAIAFSAAAEVRIRSGESGLQNPIQILRNEAMSPLFLAVIESTEEAVYNSLFRARTVKGRDGHIVEALPIPKTVELLRKYNALTA